MKGVLTPPNAAAAFCSPSCCGLWTTGWELLLRDLLYSGAWAALLVTVPSAVLTACPKPAWLHATSAAVLGGPPMVLTSLRLCRPIPVTFPGLSSGTLALPQMPKSQFCSTSPSVLGLYCNWGYTFTDILSWIFSLCPASVILLDPFMPWKSVPHQRLLHTAKFKLQRHVQPWSPLDHRASVCWSRGNISQKASP